MNHSTWVAVLVPAAILVLCPAAVGAPTTEPATQPALTLQQRIAALDASLNDEAHPPTPDERMNLAREKFQLQEQLARERAANDAARPASQSPAMVTLLGGQFPDLASIRGARDGNDTLKSLIAQMKPPVNDGLWTVSLIGGGPAEKAGIKPGDLVVSIAGVPTPTTDALGPLQASAKVGEKYPVVFLRPGETKDGVWRRMTVMVVAERMDKFAEFVIQGKSAEWEKQQPELDPEHRPYELKGDRLGMTLEMFKRRYHRTLTKTALGQPLVAPLCSDRNPGTDDSWLFYKAEYAKAGIVHASTTFSEEFDVPTIAGVRTRYFVYKFVDGRLYEIFVVFDHFFFNQVMDALRAKYGDPKGKETHTYQNAFGAKFDGDVVLWSNAVSEVMVDERAGALDQSLLVVTHKELAKTAADRIKAKVKPRTDDL